MNKALTGVFAGAIANIVILTVKGIWPEATGFMTPEYIGFVGVGIQGAVTYFWVDPTLGPVLR